MTKKAKKTNPRATDIFIFGLMWFWDGKDSFENTYMKLKLKTIFEKSFMV